MAVGAGFAYEAITNPDAFSTSNILNLAVGVLASTISAGQAMKPNVNPKMLPAGKLEVGEANEANEVKETDDTTESAEASLQHKKEQAPVMLSTSDQEPEPNSTGTCEHNKPVGDPVDGWYPIQFSESKLESVKLAPGEVLMTAEEKKEKYKKA